MRAVPKRKWIFPALLLAGVLCVGALLFSYTAAGPGSVFLTPYLDDPKGWEIYTQDGDTRTELTPREMLEAHGRTVYLSRVLEQSYEAEGLTYMELDSFRPSAVFLDGELLYTTCPQIVPKVGEIVFPSNYEGIAGRGEAVRFSLPPGYAGKTLTIATTAPQNAGTPMVVLSGQAVGDKELSAAVSRAAMPAAACAVAALLMLGVFLYNGSAGKWDFSLLLLLLAAFAQCLHYLAAYETATDAYYALSVPASALFQPMFVYLPMLFLLFSMRRRRQCTPFLLTPMLLSLLPLLCAALGIDTGIWYTVLSGMVYVAFAVLLVFSVREARQGNETFRLFLPCLGLAAACVVCLYAATAIGGDGLISNIRTVFTSAWGSLDVILVSWMGTALFAACAAVSIILMIRRTARAQTDLQVLKAQNDFAAETLQTMRESNEQVAAVRHNMIHHLTAIEGLARARENDRVAEYAASLLREASDIRPVRLTGNSLVNSILTSVAGRALRAGVKTEFHVELPETLSIPDNDLCNFLMNLLDNALQAAAAMPRVEDRWIRLTMHVRKRYLFIETENPYRGTLTPDPATGLYHTQKEGSHGYGMKTMLEIARRYHSELQTEATNGVFLVRTALLLPE